MRKRTRYVAFRAPRGAIVAAFTVAATCLCVPAAAQEATPVEQSEADWQLIEAKIRTRANEIANSQVFFEDDQGPITVGVSLDVSTRKVVMELDLSFSKYVGGLELEDFMSRIRVGSEDLTELIPGFTYIDWIIGGHDMDYWFAQVVGQPAAVTRPASRAQADRTEQPKIVVAAGHGVYYHTKYGWTTQRAETNAVLEDEITQVFARELSSSMPRNGADPVRIRGSDVGLVHEPSGKPWASMAARYFIENWRPDKPELWNSKPGNAYPLLHRDQDIRSRPLYANFIGADAVVHLHTNADKASATGTRILVQPGRAVDLRLAELSLCGMKEAIHSDSRYASYFVPSAPSAVAEKGENRLATVPSMIVEVGFHTNVSDAARLLDADFQKLSMRGLAKGMRLFREEKTCIPFAVQSHEAFTGVIGRDVQMPIAISGNPVFPVDLISTQLGCSEGSPCKVKSKLVFSQKEADDYRFSHLCWRGDESKPPAEFRVEAKDFEGIRTAPVTYQVKCTGA